MSHRYRTILHRWFDEVWNQRLESSIEEMVCDDSVCYADGSAMVGPREFRERQFAPFIAAFPDLKVEVLSILTDNDEAAVHWKATGTHTGEGLGFPPAGRSADFSGVSWIQFRDGKFSLGWQYTNIGDVIRALATPVPA
ncbi:MAG: ester cyclase [Isosphaeraceae bacterium]